jgi:rod shape determining protein RodA
MRVRGNVSMRIGERVHGGLVIAALALVGFGTLMVWSATATMTGHDALVKRHLIGVVLGLLPLAFLWVLDYKTLKGWTGPLMVLLAFLIISPRIPGLGVSVSGATSWLQIAGIRLFQPSEPAKLLFIVVMAAVIAEYEGKVEKPRDIRRIALFAAVPLVLILLQPDLGTGLVFVFTTLGMLLVGGLKPRWFLILGVAGVLLVGLVLGLNDGLNRLLSRGPYNPVYVAALQASNGDSSAATVRRVADTSVLIKQYQMDRLLVFVDSSRDPQGAGYNLKQSQIAIGSGGLTGKGLNGVSSNAAASQSNLNFIPERHTDFIFSVLGEQLGFLGAVLLLGMYLALLAAALSISSSSRDLFGALIAAGLISMWAFQILENVGMTIGVMPITGIPLPFMSFGSSFMVTNLAGVGILLSIWSRRYGTQTT